MSKKDNLGSWLFSTPKHLVVATFLLAGCGIVMVLVTLFVVAPQIAAMSNAAEEDTGETTNASTSKLLVEVKGQNFRNNSTLRMAASKPGEENPDDPGAAGPLAALNLEGLDGLTFPESLTSVSDPSNSTKSGSGKYPSSSRRSFTPEAQKNTVNSGDPVMFTGMQAFFSDLRAGNFGKMQRSCWTITPEVFTDRYTTAYAQASLLAALQQVPKATETGVDWSNDTVTVKASWAELSTRYSCPTVAYGGKVDAVTPEDVTYLMDRIMARSSYPVSYSDTEENYPILCPEWNPPQEITKYDPEAAKKLSFDENGRAKEQDFKTLQKLRSRSIRLYTKTDEYPMYIRAAASQLDEPSAYFYRDANGSLCIGSLVVK